MRVLVVDDEPTIVEVRHTLGGIVALHSAETIAAVIVEPMAGSTAVLPAPQGYLQRLRAINFSAEQAEAREARRRRWRLRWIRG